MYRVEVKHTDNADKFRQPALTFQKNGYYCPYPKGTTSYRKYWLDEMNHCIQGFTSEDGEWISGYNYFYLNYSQIITRVEVEVVKNNKVYKKLDSSRNFPDFWDYDRAFFDAVEEAENNSKHLTYLKPRGCGASFKGASMLARNYFLLRESTSLAITEEVTALTDDGILTKAWDIIDFINENTAWSKKSQKINTKTHKRASIAIKRDGVESEIGYKSEIIGFSVKNNPDKPRGKRFKLTIVDEIGLVQSPIHLHSVMREGAERDGLAYGLILLQGTGGAVDADYSEMRRLFYEPDVYNFLEIENVWDEGQYGKACGFFWPKYYNMLGFMDKNGNSDIEGAKLRELTERERIIANASDRNQIDRHCAERPFVPEEALLQISQNIFPKKELLNHLTYIRSHDKLRNFKQVGDLLFGEHGALKWEPSKKPKDITSYRLKKDEDQAGQVVIWEHPVDNPPYGLYIMGCDPYDHDQALSSTSLGSVFVYKRFQTFEKYHDLPVAEYTGRPNSVDEFYENVRKLALYYNAKVLYENEKKGLFIYFSHRHCEYLLADQPSIIRDIMQESRVERGKGIHMNKQIKQYGELKLRDWLNEEYEPGKKNLTKILSEALLEELIEYNPDGNFDRVIAFFLCILYNLEIFNIQVKDNKKQAKAKLLFPDGLFRENMNGYNDALFDYLNKGESYAPWR